MIANSTTRAMLLALVRFYRRRLTGRGPLSGVRCTFTGLETCSAFAERALVSAPSVADALPRIVRRLRRCRDLSLYRLADGALGWGCGYDPLVTSVAPAAALQRLEQALAIDGESDSVRAAVCRAAALVCNPGAAGPECRPVSPKPASGFRRNPPALLVRHAPAVRKAYTQRFWTRAAAAVFFAGLGTLACCLGETMLAILPPLAAAALASLSALSCRRVIRRLDWLAILASVEGPTEIPVAFNRISDRLFVARDAGVCNECNE